MKKFSLFILGILFCATNAWGDVTLPITYPADGTSMQVKSVSGVYSNVKYEIDVVFMSTMWTPLPIMGISFGGGTTDIRVSGYTNASGNLTIQKTIDKINAGGKSSAINNASYKLVKSIKDGAFVGFTGTLNLPDPGSDAAISISSFANVFGANSTATVIVPGGTKEKYVNAGWDGTKLTEEGQGQVIATEGDFGTNLHWEYDDDWKKLTITGTGTVIPDYALTVANNAYVSTAPWKDWVNSIEMVSIVNNVTTIGEGAFALCPNLEFLSLPSSLTSIGSYAFFNCSSLPDLTIAESVTSIGEKAFYNSSALSQLTIKSGNTLTIGANAFAINNGTASISITAEAETAPTIESNTFNNRKGVGGSSKVEVTVPSAAAKTAYENAWRTENFEFQIEEKCGDNLTWEYDLETKTLTISKIDPSGTAVMYNYAKVADSERAVPGLTVEKSTAPWYDCLYSVYQKYDGIEHVVLPSDLSNIGNYAFYKFTELEAIDIPSTVTTIGEGAFRGCRVLTGITLPASLNSLGASAFMSTALTEISITNGVTTINNETFSSCSALNKIILPASLTSIGESAFNSCVALSEIEFPNTLQTIGNHAFYDCFELRTITLPENVTSIGYEAFVTLGNDAETKGTLSTLIMKGNTPPDLVETTYLSITVYAFNGTIDVYVPAGSKEDYIEAWGTEKGDAMTQSQSRNYTFNYHEYGFSGETGEKICSFQDETNQETNAIIQELVAAGEEVQTVTIERPIQANGNLNTICLPFALSAAQIANSDLAGATIYAFTAEDGVSEEKLLTLSPVTSMQAGVPYFFAYTNNAANTPNLSKLVFNDVLLTTAVEEPVDLDAGTFVLHGTLRPTRLNHASNYLFLGAENSLFYPQLEGTTEAEQTINPFRAYFEAKSSANHAPARFVFGRPMPTNVENVQGDKVQCTKVLENGKIIIIRNGEKYTIDGKQL